MRNGLKIGLLPFTVMLIIQLLGPSKLVAQGPEGVNYQAVARDLNGNALANQLLSGVRFGILSSSPSGTLQYEEQFDLVQTNNFGLFNLVIGRGNNTNNGLLANFDEIDWGADSFYLRVEIDAGNGFEVFSTSQFVSVPYALYAKNTGYRVKAGAGILVVNNDSIINIGDTSNTNELVDSLVLSNSRIQLYQQGVLQSEVSLDTLGKGRIDSLATLINSLEIRFEMDSISLRDSISNIRLDFATELNLINQNLSQRISLDSTRLEDLRAKVSSDSLQFTDSILVIRDSIAIHRDSIEAFSDSITELRTDLNDHISNDDDISSTNELNTSVILNGTDLEVTDAGGTITVDLSGLVGTDDQNLSLNATRDQILIENGTGISIAYILDSITDLQARYEADSINKEIDIANNAANIATNASDIATNQTNIATNTTDIATNATDIANNTTAINTNTTNIATNASDIATNQTNIATNTTDIATNATDIANNTTAINTNTTNIATNASDIATNQTNIATNTTDIATNATDIANNTTAINTNTTNIATNASDIATNQTNIATNTTDIATNATDIANNTTAINTNTTNIATNASDIATNQTNIATNTTDIATNATDIANNTTAINTNTTNIATNASDIATNQTNIATNTTDIATNATDIANNTTAINTNTTNIATNASDIATNQTNIATNTTDIATNATDIANNTTAINTNTTNIATNASDIATNQTNIATNTTDIATNATDIANNTTAINTNTTNIATNASDIATNQTNIATNTTDIATNATDIANNTTAINTNTTNIATNASDIATNQTNIATNTTDIATNATDIANNTTAINTNTTNIATNASDIATNQTNIATNTTDIATNATDIANNTTAINTNTTNIATNASDIATNQTNIATNTTDIATNATDIANNTTAINTNTTNIATNASDIATNQTNIATNTTDIATNATDIANNTTAINTNTTNLNNHIAADGDLSSTNELNTGVVLNGTDLEVTDAGGTITVDLSSLAGTGTDDQNLLLNAAQDSILIEDGDGISIRYLLDSLADQRTDILDNRTNISTNTTDIATNATDIANNITAINTNTTNIATNASDIATNQTNIATNTTDIATNATDIANNTTAINTNTTNIATNASDIATNQTNIATNTTDIATNATDIANNTTAINTNTTNLNNHIAADGDLSSTNELNTGVVLNGTDLEVTDAGGTITVDLSSLAGTGTDDQNLLLNAAQDSILIEDGDGISIRYLLDSLADQRTDILGNRSNITTNTTNIATNATDIANNTTAINTNTTNIATNASDIATNQTNIANNTTSITTNATNIATNTTNITENADSVTALRTSINTHIAADGDLSSTNELNTGVVLNGTDLEVTDAGGTITVDLSSLAGTGTDDQNLLLNAAQDSILIEDGDGISIRYLLDSLADQRTDILDNRTNISTNTTDIATNATDIANNTTAINTNTTNIATNASDIATNQTNIATNTTDIATNATDIANNTTAINTNTTNLNNHIAADGDLSSTNELNTGVVLNGTDLEVTDAGGTITVDLSSLAGGPGSDNQNLTINAAQDSILIDDGAGVSIRYLLDSLADQRTDILGNRSNITTNTTNIATNATDIANNTTAITTNTTNIATNASDIATNQTNIANNTTNIITNATNIATNATNITENADSVTALRTSINTHIAADGDLSSTNELNTGVVLNGTDLEVTDAGGTITVDLSSLAGTGTDDQNLLLNATQDSILIEDGTGVSIAYILDSITNNFTEIAALDARRVADSTADATAIAANVANITTNATNIATNTTNITTNATNIATNATNITENADSVTALRTSINTHIAADGDLSSTNELNTGVVLNGTDLEVTDAGGTITVDLSSLNNSGTDDQGLSINAAQDSILIEDGTGVSIAYILDSITNNFTEIAALDARRVADSTADATAIAANAANITTNTTNIATNTTNITTNATNIATNATNITENADSVTALRTSINTHIAADGDLSSTNELNTGVVLNGTDLEVTDAGGTIIVDLSSLNNSGTDDQGLTINAAQDSILIEDGTGVSIAYILDSITNNVTEIAALDARRVADSTADATAIAANAANITTNATNIATNTTNVTTNTTNIATNATNITENADSVTALRTSINTHIAADGDLSSTNELNTGVVLNGTDLEVTDAGGTITVDLSSLNNSGTDDQGLSINAAQDSILIEDGTGVSIAYILDSITNNFTEIAALDARRVADSTTDATAIAANAANITTNATNIATNTTNITTNATNIATNATNITENADSVTALRTSINTHIAADGDLSSTNELNTGVVLNGTDLEVTDAGGTISVDLSSLSNPDVVVDSSKALRGAYWTGEDTLNFYDDLVFDTTNSRIGIGTTTPSQTLDVNGRIRSQNGFNANDGTVANPAFTFELDNTMGIYRPAANTLGFSLSGNEVARFSADGNLGIGGAPEASSRLHIIDDVNNGYAELRIENINAQDGSQIVFEEDGQGNNFTLRYRSLASGAGNWFQILSDGESTVGLVIERDNGDVGIGTAIDTDPAAKLEVNGEIKIGANGSTDAAGMIQWTGTDFEGYNGTDWVSLTTVDTAVCPAGMANIGGRICIDSTERVAATWFQASTNCAASGYKLPTRSEWYGAITNAALNGETDNWEWVDNNSFNVVSKVGSGAAENHATDTPTDTEVYRCILYLK